MVTRCGTADRETGGIQALGPTVEHHSPHLLPTRLVVVVQTPPPLAGTSLRPGGWSCHARPKYPS